MSPLPATYSLRRGNSPLIVSMPHVGTDIPEAIAARLTPVARTLADTDWHLPRVYDFLESLDATVLVATQSRLVVDLNRPPDGSSLYPGQSVTGLVPVDTFHDEPVYAGQAPDAHEIAARCRDWWQPYHDALAGEIERLRAVHPRVALWDAHSIASELPRFFDGRLPDLNFGTANGAACDAGLIEAIIAPVRAQSDYTWVLDGRYKGGYITRRYGQPDQGVHAVQLEMAQVIYMDESAPFSLRPERCERLRPLLRACVAAMHAWAATG
ncbi:MAG: N-formylglutamate deformylase [Burkholderiaceae bacterium]|nr:N-formylglutamate deformylase [Burkholderiaceae bacterium]